MFGGAAAKLATSNESHRNGFVPPIEVWSNKPFSVESSAIFQVSLDVVYGATELAPPAGFPAIGTYVVFQSPVAENSTSLNRAL